MRLSLEWLAEFIDLPPGRELADRLNLGGFEDVEVEIGGPDLTGVVVGHVLEHVAHPGADRLSLCRVDRGDEIFDVVCGAPNVAVGQKIAYAPAGTRLPDGRVLKKAKIRGVVSNGMICSEAELGLGEDPGGILVLDPDAPVGAPLAEVIRTGDGVLDVGLTPNRGDAASLLGIAREVRALVGGEIRIPDTAPDESGAAATEAVSVTIDAVQDCHHYVARVVRGVRVAPSPEWLVQRLEASGIRAINNVVDITNQVLLEFGQPLHAFDLGQLRGGRVGVRTARAGEKLACLDGETRELAPEDLVICDAERAIALAGVMGGADTEVGETTRDVLIESAYFRPTVVRLGARRHGLKTEASYRFERGVDRDGVARAADRAARLMAEIAGGQVAAGRVEARGDAAPRSEEIAFDVSRANRLLGTDIGVADAAELLARVGLTGEATAEGVIRCQVPSYRNDLHLQQDIA
ncbi:MAG: phenylalanine--tRNA ligase subunit beta, partial [Myxococcota bacterium]